MPRHRSLFAALLAALLLASYGCSPTADGGASAQAQAQRQAVKQKATLAMHPQLAQPGKGKKSADAAKSVVSVAFKPVRSGRTVRLQRQKGSRWVDAATARQDDRGVAEFRVPHSRKDKVLTYRAVAAKVKGLRKVVSKPVATDKWGDADFTEEFAVDTLGSAWSHRLQGYSAASKRKCSKADERAVRVGRGAVRLSVLSDPDRADRKCTVSGKKYDWRLNGHIGTEGQQAFTYGYAAARVKFQALRGQHASFWMQPASREVEEGPASRTGAEIDVIEWFGNDHPSGGLTSFVYHYPDDDKPGVTGKKVGGFIKRPEQYGNGWAKKYHVFSVEWTPKRYVFRIDGKETFRTKQGVSGRPQYLILSLLSSDYELPLLGGDDKLPQHMSVDWVRYWER